MSNPYNREVRRNHVYFVQENDEIVIHFTHPDWPQTEMLLTCKDGVVSMHVEQEEGHSDHVLVWLRRDGTHKPV